MSIRASQWPLARYQIPSANFPPCPEVAPGAEPGEEIADLLGRHRFDLDVADGGEPATEVVLVADERVGAERLGGLVLQKTGDGFGQSQAR